MTSTKTTGDEPVEAIDPGGARPAKGVRKEEVQHHIETGDRNKRPDPATKPET